MSCPTSNILVDHLIGRRTVTKDLLWIGGFALLTAVMAQIEVRLPFTLVPLTGQTFAVLLSGAVLGSRRGFASQTLYLGAGALGFPFFSGGGSTFLHLLGPTGGYLWSFPVAAGLLGWLVEHGAGRKTWKLALALILADGFILLSGAFWLSSLFGVPCREAFVLGFYPFLVSDILKVVLVGFSLPRLLRAYDRSS